MSGHHAVRWILGFVGASLGACQPMVDGSEYAEEEFESTYSTEVREELPEQAGEGDAPFAGSLGPPEHMVEPEITGETTMTREGSSGPPVRVGTGGEDEPRGIVEPGEPPADPNRRQYLRGHTRDAHRVRPGPGGARPEPERDYSPAEE